MGYIRDRHYAGKFKSGKETDQGPCLHEACSLIRETGIQQILMQINIHLQIML